MSLSSGNRPNVLYIQSDQHNPAVIGCYGDPLVRTPNLDALARGGVAFDSAYCPSPICVPSRASMMTGRYPHELGVWTNMHMLDSGVPTFAHALGAAGYRPVQIGRMHFIGPDQLHGFAERHVGDHSPNYVGGAPADHGMLEGTAGPARVSLQKSGHGQSAYQVHDEYVTAATVDFINSYGIRNRSEQNINPFALSVGLMLPHQPFVARKEDFDIYRDVMTMPKKQEAFSERLHPYIKWWRQQTGIEEVTDEEVIRCRIAYWALVTRMDAMIGEILHALERNEVAENTLVIYTSDHGEQIGEHGLWWKQTFYEDSARVPAIMSWPGVIPEGLQCDRVISQLDLNATMLEATGAPPLPGSHGRSLLNLVLAPSDPEWEDIAFSEYCTDNTSEALSSDVPLPEGHEDGWYHRMVRWNEWKLIYYHGMEPQLFNLKEDPEELHDMSQALAHSEIKSMLIERVLDGWNPDAIATKMKSIQEAQKILGAWTRNVNPKEDIRWNLKPEMDFLDDPQE